MFQKILSEFPVPLTVPLMRGHLRCRDTIACPHQCPYKAGTTVYIFIYIGEGSVSSATGLVEFYRKLQQRQLHGTK